MNFKIGFTAKNEQHNDLISIPDSVKTTNQPRKSVVQVHFPARGLTCAYYNDSFDLHQGDLVYVSGKLEGLRGRVVDVSYTFKIKLSDYQRVIAVADTQIEGELFMAGSHFVAFDRMVIPFEKILPWFKAPIDPEEEYVSSGDGNAFSLETLSGMKIKPQIAERGEDYYMANKVVYLCVDGTKGRAIVEGTEPYEVEFTYQNGLICDLVCSCFCSYTCKHEFATMLQLRETLKNIEEHYSEQYKQTDYFAAITKTTLFSFAVDHKTIGSIKL